MNACTQYLNAWNSETKRFYRVVGKPKGLGKLNSRHVTVVLREEAKALMQGTASVMRERTNVW